MFRKLALLVVICVVILSQNGYAAYYKKSISQYGITWEFTEPVPVGRFVTGDYYVVGSCTIASITPAPTVSPARHGSQLDLHLSGKTYTDAKAGWDDRIPHGRYEESYRAYPPIHLHPGQALISSVSVEKPGEIENMFRPGYFNDKISTKTMAVITCLEEEVDSDAFRPGYADPAKTLYYARNLRRNLLPSLPKVTGTPELHIFEEYLDRPWVETGYDEFTVAGENMPCYGREYTRLVSHAALLLCLDFSPEEKEDLLLSMVQLGIDIRGLIEAGYKGWPAVGGHGNGRKLPLLFAGLMLNDSSMLSPYSGHPDVQFSEDIQTMYATGWTGAKAVFAGHAGKDGHPGKPDWGAYEHLHPRDWPGTTGESYRRCCTSITWVGEATAARLLGLEMHWDHPSFFDYVERWMTEDDSEFLKVILRETGKDFSQDWARQKQAWDEFVEQMYAHYWQR